MDASLSNNRHANVGLLPEAAVGGGPFEDVMRDLPHGLLTMKRRTSVLVKDCRFALKFEFLLIFPTKIDVH